MGLTETATRKVGPLPAWGWGAVIVGGYIAYRFVSGGSSDSTTEAGVPSWAGGLPDGSGGGGGGSTGSTGDTAVLDALAAIRAAIAAIPGPGSSGGGSGASGGGTGSGTGGSTGSGGTGIAPSSSGAGGIAASVAATPGNIWNQTLDAIMKAGLYSPNAQGAYTGKTKEQWIALAQQYGGEAAAIAYRVMSGLPSEAAALHPGGTVYDEYADRYFTGVVGTTTNDGKLIYQAFRDGQLIGERTGGYNIDGSSFDTSAWGESLGLNPWNWYEGSQFERDFGSLIGGGAFPGSASPISAPDTNFVPINDLTDEIATLQRYIANLQGVANPTSAQTSKLAEYQRRLAEYTNRQASYTPPSFSTAPITSGGGTAAPSVAATPVNYSAAIKTLQGYIANLQTGTVTTADREKIALYQARIADYSSR